MQRLLIWVPLLTLTLCALELTPLERAVTLARQKNYAEARKVLQGVAEPSGAGQRIAFHRLKAAIASGLGDGKTAAAEMRLALALAPNEVALVFATALAELQAGLLDDALRHAQAVPNDAQVQAFIGDIQEKRGKFVEAANAYQLAVTLAPDREQYRIALALELVEHQNFTPAIAVLQQAAPLFPRSGKIRTLLGIAQYGEGDLANARTSFLQAIAADPKLQPAYFYLTRIVLESSAAPPGEVLQPLCGWNATVCSALKLRVAREKDDPKLQGEAIAGLMAAPPEDSVARCELGRAYQWTGQLPDARTQMEACVRLDPSPQNHYRLGLIYRELGLTQLSDQQMTLRQKSMDDLTEETNRRSKILQTFQYVLK